MIYSILINSVAVFIASYLLEGVKVRSFFTAILVAIVLALINTFIRPIILFLTLPLTILTLGLFVLVINALILMLIDRLLDGFEIRNFWWAVGFSIVLSLLNTLLFWIF
jgi:putative membrane protein